MRCRKNKFWPPLTTPPSRARRLSKDTMQEHRDHHPYATAFQRGGRDVAKRGAIPISRVQFWTMTGGVDPRPGGQSKTWCKCLVDDLRVLQATEGPRNPPRWCLELRPRCGKWQQRSRASDTRGVLEAAERFMARSHEDKATLSRQRQASIMGGVQGNGERRRNSRRETAVDESRKEAEGRVARYQTG